MAAPADMGPIGVGCGRTAGGLSDDPLKAPVYAPVGHWVCQRRFPTAGAGERGCSRIGRTGRISMEPTRAGGIRAASWIASFKSRA